MQYFYIKDENGNTREDAIRAVDSQGIPWTVPNDPKNTHWVEYQAWLAADPENNIPQEEGE